MSRIAIHKLEEKYINYSLPSSKKNRSIYHEKEHTVSDLVYKKLKKVTKLLESLYHNLSEDSGNHIKAVIEKNLKLLINDIEIMHNSLKKSPFSFNTNKLKTNQHCLDEMKAACDSLQKLSAQDVEVRQLAKIKHALHELDLLIQHESSNVKAKNSIKEPTKPVEQKKQKRIAIMKKATTATKTKKAPAKKAKTTTAKKKAK